jgi:hypothetical protein
LDGAEKVLRMWGIWHAHCAYGRALPDYFLSLEELINQFYTVKVEVAE